MADVDLDDTTNCPKATTCASCGTRGALEVVPLTTPVGVLCATVCGPCQDEDQFGVVGWSAAALAVGAHASHLGIDVDQMAEILAAEQDER